jgi:hypothetical protein
MAHYIRIDKQYIGVPLSDATVKSMTHVIGAEAGDVLMTGMTDPLDQFVISQHELDRNYRCLDKPKRGRPRSRKIISASEVPPTISQFIMPTVREVTRKVMSNLPPEEDEGSGQLNMPYGRENT